MLSDRALVQPNELRAQASATLVKRLFADLQILVSQEVQFARAELECKSSVVATTAGFAVLAYGIAIVAIACASFAIIVLVAPYAGLFLAALIVAVLLGFAAYLCMQAAKKTAGGLLPLRSATFVVGTSKPESASLDDQAIRIESTRKRVQESFDALERKGDLLTPLRNTAAGVGALSVAVASILRHSNGSDRTS